LIEKWDLESRQDILRGDTSAFFEVISPTKLPWPECASWGIEVEDHEFDSSI
jgi:hypothetical protein